MAARSGGWFHQDVENAIHGTNYQFLLDTNPHPYPDPRSAWQPDGVHGPSRVLEHSRHLWSDQGWSPTPLSRAVVYELHIGTFTPQGTFFSAIEKLVSLRDLGVTHVELMPVNSFPGRWGWGYDGAALFAPQEAYGGPEGLKLLVDACHAEGLSVLLDVVYNHFGPVGNYTGVFGPYITNKHHTPWGGAINFDMDNNFEVRRFFCDNALMWMRDYHIDGLRLDAVHAFVDRSATHILQQLSEETQALSSDLGRELVLIAESDWNDPRVVTPKGSLSVAGSANPEGYGIDAQWSDDFHHAVFAFMTGERKGYYQDFGLLAQVAKALKSVFVFDGIHAKYRNGIHGKPVRDLAASRFLGYIQNHDQVGNRAYGDRVASILGMRKSMLAAALVMTAPFVPMIFQGEEFAASSPFFYFADHDEPEMARAVSEGRRREHAPDGDWDSIPDPEARESFERSKLNWGEVKRSPHAEMLDWYRKLIHLRKTNTSLLNGELEDVAISFSEEAKWLVLKRGSMQMLFNFSDTSALLPVPPGSSVLLATDEFIVCATDTLQLPAQSFAAIHISNE